MAGLTQMDPCRAAAQDWVCEKFGGLDLTWIDVVREREFHMALKPYGLIVLLIQELLGTNTAGKIVKWQEMPIIVLSTIISTCFYIFLLILLPPFCLNVFLDHNHLRGRNGWWFFVREENGYSENWGQVSLMWIINCSDDNVALGHLKKNRWE